ncbi:tRNA methyltransferase [Pisolithus orientalis]|uniref:tRNA methyltransferase n=1 Tax=Pisolithus orientalis TaxID=936130 RepID=UPI0022254253|nr:tRNA methyltransferase [Pisolithus orientalis]KAI5997783.1 tRNA methyltransferase [Pisolithus orientalis]
MTTFLRALRACHYRPHRLTRGVVIAMSGQVRHHSVSDQEDTAPAEKRPRVDVSEANLTPASTRATSSIGQGQKKQHARKEKKRKKHAIPEPCSTEDVLWHDVVSLLGSETVDQKIAQGVEWESPFDFREELEVTVSALSSNGDALAIGPDPRNSWVIVVPFALPGERVRVRVYRSSRLHSFADLLEVVSPNLELRGNSRVRCKYFGKCSGCQYQMLSYESQLDIKRNVVIKAYQNFSGLIESSIPTVLPTIGSPLQYNYRTKITPHFEAAPKRARQTESADASTSKPDWLKIGFNEIGKRTVMDIEECPIATPVLNEALGRIRKDIIGNIWSYKKGVSLLLRDSIKANPANEKAMSSDTDSQSQEEESHICITDPKAIVREKVGEKYFEFPGHSFFQNNNSILVPLTDYVRDAIFPTSLKHSPDHQHPTHLVDAYCGSGLFSIMLCSHFQTVAGIELSADSIKFATHNAHLNDIPEGRCTFRAGDAANIFSVVSEFPREKTALIIDPPRKGCDENFIDQLVAFRCKTVVYVSCNVHTQARDVGMILDKMGKSADEKARYVVESLRGFDLFPQTAHVESVAVLRLI